MVEAGSLGSEAGCLKVKLGALDEAGSLRYFEADAAESSFRCIVRYSSFLDWLLLACNYLNQPTKTAQFSKLRLQV